METFTRDVVGEGVVECLMPCAFFLCVTLVIMLWSAIVGRLGSDASDDKVCDTFWRLMRRFIERY